MAEAIWVAIGRDPDDRASLVTATTPGGATTTVLGDAGWEPVTITQLGHHAVLVLQDVHGHPIVEVTGNGLLVPARIVGWESSGRCADVQI